MARKKIHVAGSFAAALRRRAVHQDALDQLRRHSEKPASDQNSDLQRSWRPLPGHVPVCDSPEFVLHQRNQQARTLLVAASPVDEQFGHLLRFNQRQKNLLGAVSYEAV